MWRCWTPLILALTSRLSLIHCQSGDGDWGSGFDPHPSNDSVAVGDEPERKRETSSAFSPVVLDTLHPDPRPDSCSVHFTTDKVLLRMLKAQKEALSHLQALQRGNQAVVENLVQFLGAEVGEQSYEDVIRENILGIQEEQKKCHQVVEKAEEDLEKQLEGETLNAQVGMKKIKEESSAFDEMLGVAADMAARLERSSKSLQESLAKQLRDIAKLKIHH